MKEIYEGMPRCLKSPLDKEHAKSDYLSSTFKIAVEPKIYPHHLMRAQMCLPRRAILLALHFMIPSPPLLSVIISCSTRTQKITLLRGRSVK